MHNFSPGQCFFWLFLAPLITVGNYPNEYTRVAYDHFETVAFNDSLPARNLEIHTSEFENENILVPGESIQDKVRKNLFVLSQVSKSECFVGEPITVTYKLYSRLNVQSTIVAQPILTGFSKDDIVNVASLDASIEMIGGKRFEVHVLRKTQLVPLIAGNLEIDPMEIEHKINFIKSHPDSAAQGVQLTDFINRKKDEEQVFAKLSTINTRSSPLRITVRDIPDNNKPSTYSGAVGFFSVKANLSPGIKICGETARITLEIKGRGNLLFADAPGINLPNEIELLSVKSQMRSQKSSPGLSSIRSFEYLVLLRKQGFVKIEPIAFSYFDPNKRIYQTKYSMPIFIEVLENPKLIHRQVASKKPLHEVGKRRSNSGRNKNVIILFMIAVAGSLVFFVKNLVRIRTGISTLLAQSKKKRVNQAPDTPFFRAAGKLAPVVGNMDRNDLAACYYELNRILWIVIKEKINLLPTELSKGNIFQELSKQGWTPEEVWQLELTMTEYERNLYVPGYKDEDDFEMAYANALRIITKLEQIPVQG